MAAGRPDGARLCRRQIPADQQPGRPRARHAARPGAAGGAFPEQVRDWLALQQERSTLPGPDDLLVEVFPRNGRWYTVAYCFEGRNAHQTLGMLLTRRMERAGAGPARLRRHRLRDRRLVRQRARRHGRAVPAGHAGRRPGGLDGGELAAAAHLPQRGGHRRAGGPLASPGPTATGGRSRSTPT